jgi:ABC-2 type transport system permease protein
MSPSRALRIYREFVRSSLVRELEFKANFVAKIVQNALWVCFFLAVLFVIYGRTDEVAGWSRGEAAVLAATVFFVSSISAAVFFGLTEIPEMVRRGTLDFVLIRPFDAQGWVSFRKFNFDQVGSLLVGVATLIVGLSGSPLPSAAAWGGYVVCLLAGTVLFYSFNLALMTTGVWFVRVDNFWVLSDSVTNVTRFPLDIYRGGLQRLLTHVVPLAFLGTVPARQLVRGFDGPMVVEAVAWAAGSVVLSRLFWRFALTRYGSASS